MSNQFSNSKSQKIFFITLGCRLNQAESLSLKEEALKRGFVVVRDEKEADILIVNSCSVTDKAQRDTEKTLKSLSQKYPSKKLVVTGCGARDEHKKYAVVVKNEEKGDLFSLLSSSGLTRGSRRNKESNWIPASTGMTVGGGRTRLMVKVQDGCNNFCSYCIVPYLRGREQSRSTTDIIKELKEAEKRGYKEIVLCGVNIGKYSYSLSSSGLTRGSTMNIDSRRSLSAGEIPAFAGMTKEGGNDGFRLSDLVRGILKNANFPRIRLSSINPDDFSDDLVALWSQNDRLMPHFHISLQSGSDTVLRRMGRKYNTKQYSDLVAKLRKSIKDVQITTDVIVGFPGETDKEFAETINFVKKMNFLKVHVFRYSPRFGTLAAKMPDQISEKTKKERAVKLQKLESEIRQKILKKYIGEETEVLFEAIPPSSPRRRGPIYSGFTPNYIKVFKKSQKDLTNEIEKVKIKDSDSNALIA